MTSQRDVYSRKLDTTTCDKSRVFYRIQLALAQTFRPQLARSEYQLGINTIIPKIFALDTLQFTEEYIATLLYRLISMLSNRTGGARIGAKIPDWMSNNLAGREK